MKPWVTILNFILIFIISLFSATNTIPAQMIQKINRNVFIENKGQWPDDVLFMTKMGGMKAWITKTGVVYDFYKTEPHSGDLLARTPFDKKADEQIRVHGNVVKTTLVAPNLMSGRLTMDKQQGYYNYIKGNDASKWAGHVPLYKEIKITEIYDNIDIRYYFHKGHLRYDYIVKPGADPRVIKIKLSGAESYNINGQGELVLKTSLGKVKLGQLLTYQVDKSQEVPSHFVKRNDGSIGISLGAYDKNRPLIPWFIQHLLEDLTLLRDNLS